MDLVIKKGTDDLVNSHGIDIERAKFSMADFANYLTDGEERKSGLIVASGAVAMGECFAQDFDLEDEDLTQQVKAMMGGSTAEYILQQTLKEFGIASGSLRVTHYEIDNRKERPSLEKAIQACIKAQVVPIVNENDALSIKELAKLAYGGDNDGIAAHICRLIRAKNLIIFTKDGGLFDEHGREVRKLEAADYKDARKMVKEREKKAKQAGKRGRGGMSSKLKHGRRAARKGTRTFIAGTGEKIDDVLNGKTGTQILAEAA